MDDTVKNNIAFGMDETRRDQGHLREASRKAQLLILDEATSSLDNETESLVTTAPDSL